MTRRLVIIGAGGFGRGTVDVVRAINEASDGPQWNLAGVYDDNPSEINLQRLSAIGVQYLGKIPGEAPTAAMHYVIGINNPKARESISRRLDALGWISANLIHPEATIETKNEVGPGAIIRAGVRVATNSVISRHVHLNYNVVLGHDVQLQEFVSVNPLASIAGEVCVGARSIVGTGAVILQGRSVGQDCQVGASACVTKAYGDGVTLVGVPASPFTVE